MRRRPTFVVCRFTPTCNTSGNHKSLTLSYTQPLPRYVPSPTPRTIYVYLTWGPIAPAHAHSHSIHTQITLDRARIRWHSHLSPITLDRARISDGTQLASDGTPIYLRSHSIALASPMALGSRSRITLGARDQRELYASRACALLKTALYTTSSWECACSGGT